MTKQSGEQKEAKIESTFVSLILVKNISAKYWKKNKISKFAIMQNASKTEVNCNLCGPRRLFHSGSLKLKSKVSAVAFFRFSHFVLNNSNLSIHCSLWVGWLGLAWLGLKQQQQQQNLAHVSFFIAFAHWHFALQFFLWMSQAIKYRKISAIEWNMRVCHWNVEANHKHSITICK